MTAAVMAFLFGITNSVAHGGPIVALLGAVNKPLLALLCMICGAIVTGVVAVALKNCGSKERRGDAGQGRLNDPTALIRQRNKRGPMASLVFSRLIFCNQHRFEQQPFSTN